MPIHRTLEGLAAPPVACEGGRLRRLPCAARRGGPSRKLAPFGRSNRRAGTSPPRLRCSAPPKATGGATRPSGTWCCKSGRT